MEENKGNEAEEIKPDSVDDTGASEIQSELHLIVTGQPVACLSFFNLLTENAFDDNGEDKHNAK